MGKQKHDAGRRKRRKREREPGTDYNAGPESYARELVRIGLAPREILETQTKK